MPGWETSTRLRAMGGQKNEIWEIGFCLVFRECLPGWEDPGIFGNSLAMHSSEVCSGGEGAAGQCSPLEIERGLWGCDARAGR